MVLEGRWSAWCARSTHHPGRRTRTNTDSLQKCAGLATQCVSFNAPRSHGSCDPAGQQTGGMGGRFDAETEGIHAGEESGAGRWVKRDRGESGTSDVAPGVLHTWKSVSFRFWIACSDPLAMVTKAKPRGRPDSRSCRAEGIMGRIARISHCLSAHVQPRFPSNSRCSVKMFLSPEG